MEKLTILEVIEALYKNKNLMAFKEIHQGKCYIKWIDKVTNNGIDEYKQLAFININGYINYNILTDNMIDINNYKIWSLTE